MNTHKAMQLDYQDLLDNFLDSDDTIYQKIHKQYKEEIRIDRKKLKKSKHDNSKRELLEMVD